MISSQENAFIAFNIRKNALKRQHWTPCHAAQMTI